MSHESIYYQEQQRWSRDQEEERCQNHEVVEEETQEPRLSIRLIGGFLHCFLHCKKFQLPR